MNDDDELMRAVAGGDLDAFNPLVAGHQEEAWRIAFRFTGDAAQAEDLAQEAFLRILEAAPRYRPAGGFRMYLMRVLSRICIDWKRKKQPAPAGDELPDRGSPGGPADPVLEDERRTRVRSALDDLPSNQRIAVILRYYEGLSGSDIAQAMDTSAKAVERLLYRARETLEGRLRDIR